MRSIELVEQLLKSFSNLAIAGLPTVRWAPLFLRSPDRGRLFCYSAESFRASPAPLVLGMRPYSLSSLFQFWSSTWAHGSFSRACQECLSWQLARASTSDRGEYATHSTAAPLLYGVCQLTLGSQMQHNSINRLKKTVSDIDMDVGLRGAGGDCD
jgi:hypothetical protein